MIVDKRRGFWWWWLIPLPIVVPVDLDILAEVGIIEQYQTKMCDWFNSKQLSERKSRSKNTKNGGD